MTTRSGSRGTGILRDGWLFGLGTTGVRRLLNVAVLALVVATLAGWGDPDLVVDVLWVTLAIGAFVFGLRRTIIRIVVVTVVVLGYPVVEEAVLHQPAEIEILDLEWPLMVGLSILIAVLADRVSMIARHYAALYRQASDRLVAAHEDERSSLARDLHDGVGQTLTAVVLTLDAADAALSTAPDAQTAESAEAAHAAVHRARGLALAALDEARAVAAQLRPSRIQELGLGAAVRGLAESAGVPVDVRFPPTILPPGLLEPERQIDAYRIIQEAVGNAARHSHAAHVWIDAEVVDGLVGISVGDDGVGFDMATTTVGLGLVGMQERATILRGRLEVRSQPGVGTIVDLQIPVDAPLAAIEPSSVTVQDAQGALRWTS
jgi:two-component system, NarL family, sensor histidine kinase UhpB